MKILIVEAEQIISHIMQLEIEEAGATVVIAVDGEDALAKARSEKPDLILLDLVIPKKDGFEVLQELKADPDLQSIPVVVVSNFGQDIDIKKALALGAVDYFVKTQHPIKEVIEKIKGYILLPPKKR